jgi:hypothetical protein
LPLEDKAPCGDDRSAFGTCCCTCMFLIPTYPACGDQCGDAYCDSGGKDGIFGNLVKATQEGFACGYFFITSGGPVQVNWHQHGMCEGYTEREEGQFRWEPVRIEKSGGHLQADS